MPPRTRKNPHTYTPRPATVTALRFHLTDDPAIGNQAEIRDVLGVQLHVNRFRGEFHTASVQTGPHSWVPVRPDDVLVRHGDGRLEVIDGVEFERRYEGGAA